ncbi:hypothetical protein CONLIGDRAFT_702799 [Coniochaeta ligniaria NRRL 30616]|uniref:Uncharacterized protein n=1 Tax=Coniochaeta ligniaria NRRL 30616 TaxID=1408157 RepID=A0A1J7IRD3_9PEZI|nr:hypothetical protein CONLIGDRAFT_702799 [Coniochaeta ligniaria NRRL 30616]
MEPADTHLDDANAIVMGTELGTELANSPEDIPAAEPTNDSATEQTDNPPKCEASDKPTTPPSNDNPVPVPPSLVPQGSLNLCSLFEQLTIAGGNDGPSIKATDEEPAAPTSNNPQDTLGSLPNVDPAKQMVEPAPQDTPDTSPITTTLGNNAALRHWHSMVSPTHAAAETEISPKEWVDRAKPFRETVHQSWNQLHRLIPRHEETIIKRWKAGGGKYRRRLLLQHWPDMAPLRRPDLQVFMDRKPTDELLPNPFAGEVSSADEPPSVEEPPSAAGGSLLQPDPETVSSPSSEELTPQQKRRAVLWPCINLENLLKWWYLPQMLHSRARQVMAYFALQDMPPARREFLELFIRFTSVPGHFMSIKEPIVDGGKHNYGQLVCIQDEETSSKAIADKLIMEPGPGLVLLEVQARLYKFLIDMVLGILHDTFEPLSSGFEVQLDPGLISGAAAELQQIWVADEREEAPYSGSDAQYHTDEARQKQRQFNRHLVKAKWNEAHEHWKLLRYDPGYMAETVSEWKAHRLDMLLDTKGNASSLADSDIWANAVQDCVMTAFQKLLYWDEVWRRLEFLQWGFLEGREAFGKNYGMSYHQGEMSIRREIARCFLYSYLSNWEESLLYLLRKIWIVSPRLRPYSRRIVRERSLSCESLEKARTLTGKENKTEETGSEAKGKERDVDEEWRYDQDHEYEQPHKDGEPLKKRKSWQQFKWLFNSLFDEKVRSVLGLQTILDEIDYLVNSSAEATTSPPHEHWMLSDLVNWQISDLTTHSEVFEGEFKSAIDSEYHTLSALKKHENLLGHEEFLFDCRWGGVRGPAPGPRKGLSNFKGSPKLWSLGIPADGRFDYPIDKAVKTEADIKQLAKAKKALQHFWITFDRMVETYGVVYKINNIDMLGIPKSPEELRDSVLESHAKVAAASSKVDAKQPEPKSPSDDRSETPSDDGSGTGNRHSRLHIRLDVDKKALRVFRTMFVPASKEWNPVPLPWKDFAHALEQADYKMFCRYGRACLFIPPVGPPEHNHIFRQPYHGEKLTVATLRRYGLRMNWRAGGTLNFSKFSLRDSQETMKQTKSYSYFRPISAYALLEEAKGKPGRA